MFFVRLVLLVLSSIVAFIPSSLTLGNLTLLISRPTFSALLCNIALYSLNGAVNMSICNLYDPNSGPTVGCVSTFVSMSMSRVSPGNPINFKHGTSVPTPMLLLQYYEIRLLLLLLRIGRKYLLIVGSRSIKGRSR